MSKNSIWKNDRNWLPTKYDMLNILINRVINLKSNKWNVIAGKFICLSKINKKVGEP